MSLARSVLFRPTVPLSSFNLYVEDYPEPGSVLVNNTFSGAFAVLGSEVIDALKKRDAGDMLSDGELALVDDPDLCDPDVGIVVDSLEAEEAEFLEWFERRRSRSTKMDVILGVNLACNFACSYCSQEQVLDGTVMKHETADATADWLASRVMEAKLDGAHITFVGGEPLLHPDRILRIVRRIREMLEPRGLALSFGIITNGYFLTPDVVQKLADAGLTRAQVTLDGNGDTHCVTRISKKGEDTFRRVFDNVIAASKRIRVRINGNYQSDTVGGFAPLIEELAAAGFPAGSELTFSPALQDFGAGHGDACTWSEADSAYQVALHDRILARGYQPGGPANVVGPCELHDRHHYSIDPKGRLYKCPAFMGHPEWAIGDVTSGLTERYDEFLELTPKQGCSGCAHRPNCGGGCLANEWIATGSTDGVSCAKPYFDRVKDDAVVREYLLLTSDSVNEALSQFPTVENLPRVGANPERSRRSHALRVLAA